MFQVHMQLEQKFQSDSNILMDIDIEIGFPLQEDNNIQMDIYKD
jgi:hypothetical protein